MHVAAAAIVKKQNPAHAGVASRRRVLKAGALAAHTHALTARCCAEVHGPVSDELQAEFDAYLLHEDLELAYLEDHASGTDHEVSPERARHLLMKRKGKRKRMISRKRLGKITICGLCYVTSCALGSDRCRGKCKKNGKLYNCSTRVRDLLTCRRGSIWSITEALTPDPLDLFSFLTVKATSPERAPVIPCAEVTGQPTGCPAPGTPHLNLDSPPQTRRSLVESHCVTRRLPLQNCESAFHPFGYCECLESVEIVGPTITSVSEDRRPCSTRDYALGTFSTSENIDVSSLMAGEVVTRYAASPYTDESGGPLYSYNTTFELPGAGNVTFTLDTYRGFAARADRFTFNGTLLDNSVGSPGGSGDPYYYGEVDREYNVFAAAAEDQYLADRYLDGPDGGCYHRCLIAGDGVLGYAQEDFDIEEPGYSIYYYSESSCTGQCFEGDYGASADREPRRYSLLRRGEV